MTSLCPACGNRSLQTISAWLSVCKSCGLYLSELVPGPGKAFEGLETLRRQNFEIVLDELERVRPIKGARLLEIGCAKGWFLEAAHRRGAITLGVEPVASDAEIARHKGFKIEEGLFPDAPKDKGPYDIIAFNDVFEHLPNPAQAIIDVEKHLAVDGLLSINIPSSDGALFTIAKVMNTFRISGPYERMWQRGLPSPHMTYFSPENLKLLIERHSSLRLNPGASRSLPSITARGLKERIQSQPVGLPGWIVYPSMLALSMPLKFLPGDIYLGIFARNKVT